MIDVWRAVEIRNGKQAGSGYLIGPGLILTAWHVLRPADGAAMPASVDVRVLDHYRRATGADRLQTRCARLLWPQTDAGPNHDFALLQIVSDDEDPSYPFVDWSDMASAGDIDVEVIGFPDFGKFSNAFLDPAQPRLERDSVAASGRVQTGSRLKQREVYGSGAFEVVLEEESLPKGSHVKWEGISGAPVFAGDVLIGVVVLAREERPEVHRLVGLPVARLFAVDEVRAALARVKIVLPAPTPLSMETPRLGFASRLLDRFGVAQHAPGEFRAGVEHFLTGYLGRPERPVAFAGRQDMLERLSESVDGASAARILLHAPGGRGKSALVVHWLQHEAERFHLVFLPISARSGTNRPHLFYHALTVRLAEILRVKPGLPTVADPTGHYRSLAMDYMRRLDVSAKPVLLVIDGLDEAAGWELPPAFLPSLPASCLTVVVSARERAGHEGPDGWLEQLGWKRNDPDVLTLGVGPLDEAGVADVVASVDGVRTGQEYGVIARRIMQLSGGDPWLVRLYAEDLPRDAASGRLSLPADFADRHPGFGPFFRAWITEQKQIWTLRQHPVDEKRLHIVLAILSCAFGPLRHDSLADIYRLWRGEAVILPREAIEPIARFLQGDGVKSGYVLAHPRFADFLRDEYFGDGKMLHKARAAILGWGMAVVAALDAHTLAPADCPSYLVTYLGQHLVEACAPGEQMMRLVGPGWLAARYRAEGGYGGFAQDVRRAADAIEARAGADERRWAWRLRCQLVLGSITNTGAHVPGPLIVECVRAGVLTGTQGCHLLEQKTLHAASFARLDLDAMQMQSETAKSLVELARTWPQGPGRIHGLGDVLRIIGRIGSDYLRAEALSGIAGLGSSPLVAEGLFAALSIDTDKLRSGVVEAFVPVASEELLAQALEHALAAAGTGPPCDDWSTTLDVLAQSIPEALRREAVSRAGVQAVSRGGSADLASILVAATKIMPDAAGDALAASATVHDEKRRAALLEALGPRLPEALLTNAFDTVLAIEDEPAQWRALRNLIPRLPENLLAVARQRVLTWDAPYRRASAFDAMLPRVVNDGERTDVFVAALAAIEALPADGVMLRFLAELIAHAPDEQQREMLLTRALDTIGTMTDERKLASGIAAVAGCLTGPFVDRAIELVAGMSDRVAQLDVLERLVPSLPEAAAPEVFRITLGMQQAVARDRALGVLAPILPAALFPDALAAVEALAGKGGGEALVALAPRLPDDLLPRALVAALRGIFRETYEQAIETIVQRMRPETLERALTVFVEHFDAAASLPGIVHFVSQLPDRLLPVVLAGLRTIESDYRRADLLASILPRLQDADLVDARRLIETVRLEACGAKCLVALALRFPAGADREQTFTDALQVMRSAWSSHDRAALLEMMVPHLPVRLLDDVLDVVGDIDDQAARASLLDSMASRLRGSQISRSWEIARGMSSAHPRAQAMAAVAKCFGTAAERASAFEQALRSFMTIDDLPARVLALAAHLPLLPDDGRRAGVLDEALELADRIVDKKARLRALGQLAPHRFDALCRLLRAGVPLPWSELVDVLVECGAAQDHENTIRAMAESLDDHAQQGCLHALLRVRLSDAARQAYVMYGLALPDEGSRARFINASADRLTPAERTMAANAAKRITSKFQRNWALSGLQPYLPRTPLARILWRGAPAYVPADVRVEKRLQEAAASDDLGRAQVLIDIASALPARLASEALLVCASIDIDPWRAGALVALAPVLPEAAMPDALECAAAIQMADARGKAMAGIAPYLPDYLLEQALDRIEAMHSDSWGYAPSIAAMAPSLRGKDALLQRAIAFANAALTEGEDAADAMAALAAQLPPDAARSRLLESALGKAEGISAAPARIRCLRAMLPVLPPSLHERAVGALLAVAGTVPRIHLLESVPTLLAHVDGFRNEAGVLDTCEIVRDIGRWFP